MQRVRDIRRDRFDSIAFDRWVSETIRGQRRQGFHGCVAAESIEFGLPLRVEDQGRGLHKNEEILHQQTWRWTGLQSWVFQLAGTWAELLRIQREVPEFSQGGPGKTKQNQKVYQMEQRDRSFADLDLWVPRMGMLRREDHRRRCFSFHESSQVSTTALWQNIEIAPFDR